MTARTAPTASSSCPVALAKGLHRLKLAVRAGPKLRLRILFGGPGTQSLDGERFRHTSR